MFRFHARRHYFAMLVFLLLRQLTLTAEETLLDGVAAGRAARLEVMQKSVSEYSLTIGTESKPVTLRNVPVLRFTNPLRLTSDGALFLWEFEGRPVALTCIYPSGEKLWDHEFQSLTDLPIVAVRGGRTVWTPGTDFQFNPVPNTTPPSEMATARRREMGTISRRFSARLLGWGRGYERDDELRMQDAPVHRWGDPKGPIVDGGLFLFGEATDPEIALLIEAHTNGKELVWKYAIARVTGAELVVRLDDEVLWRILAWERNSRPDQPYLTVHKQPEPEPESKSK